MKPRPPWAQIGFVFALLAFATLASGCVYLRLLHLKNQLADFENHFSTDTNDGFQLTFKDPVLFGDDVRWLGAEPETIQRSGSSESWTVRWTKDVPAGTNEAGNYDVILDAQFLDRRLQSLKIPERYFAFVPKNLFLNALRSAGHARIDRRRRTAELDTGLLETGSSVTPIDLSSIEKMLGIPSQRTVEPGLVRCHYVFRPRTPRGSGKPIEITFLFSQGSGNLRKLIGKLPKGTLTFDFSEMPARKPEDPPSSPTT